MQQALGYHDENASGTFSQQLLVQNQTGLDGLAEPDFIGEQYPRGIAVGDFVGDV